MLKPSELPFALTPESLADWLGLLEKLPASRASTQFSQTLKLLKHSKVQAETLLPLLIQMIPQTLQLANSLNSSLPSEAKNPEKLSKASKLCMQLPRQLSLLFCQLVESDKLNNESLQTAIYHGLQLIGHCMLCYARQYEMASATLWKKSATLYKLALYSDVHKLEQASQINDFSAQSSIENVMQRNILFSLLNPAMFASEEIDDIFLLACQMAPQLTMGSPREFAGIGFCWDLASDAPPTPLKHIKNQFTSDQLLINCRDIGHTLQLNDIGSNLSRKSQARLALFLTGYDQIFSSIIPGLPSRAEMIVGLDHITTYLQERSKLVKILNMSAQVAGIPVLKADMSLVPLEHQRNVFETANHPFMQQQQSIGRPINVLRTPNQNYLVVDGKAFDCATGDLVLLHKEQHPDILLVVRWHNPHDLSGSTHILLEKVSNQFELQAYDSGNGVRYAILTADKNAPTEVFLCSEKYTVGSNIQLLTGKNLRLTACLETNDMFVRCRFSVD